MSARLHRGRAANGPPRIGLVLGTRPEVIKLWPVARALQPARDAGAIAMRVLSTGQQRQLLDQTLGFFQWRPDADLDVMRSTTQPEALASLHARLVAGIGRWLRDEQIDRCVVQGDTSSAHAAALAACYCGVPVSHVEAGLRTADPMEPFPEEMHRRVITTCADQHFCPTPSALQNLRREGVPPQSAWMVGNTIVDAARMTLPRARLPDALAEKRGLRLYITLHRRENHDRLRQQILPALRCALLDHPDAHAVVSAHPNPLARAALTSVLGGLDRVHLVAPLDYGASLAMVRSADLVLTDSGGLQEEATALGTPVVVLRRQTERQEAIDVGCAVMPGTSAVAIASTVHELLSDATRRAQMARASDVFGDGHAAERIAALLLSSVGAVAEEGAA